MAKFIRLRASTYSYLIDDGSEDEKAKGTKKYVIKTKYTFGKYSNCLEVTQIDYKNNEIIQKKNKISINNLKKDHKEFMRNNKLTCNQ